MAEWEQISAVNFQYLMEGLLHKIGDCNNTINCLNNADFNTRATRTFNAQPAAQYLRNYVCVGQFHSTLVLALLSGLFGRDRESNDVEIKCNGVQWCSSELDGEFLC